MAEQEKKQSPIVLDAQALYECMMLFIVDRIRGLELQAINARDVRAAAIAYLKGADAAYYSCRLHLEGLAKGHISDIITPVEPIKQPPRVDLRSMQPGERVRARFMPVQRHDLRPGMGAFIRQVAVFTVAWVIEEGEAYEGCMAMQAPYWWPCAWVPSCDLTELEPIDRPAANAHEK